MFGNYLNVLKLVFIWTNLDLKLVLKRNQFYLDFILSQFFFSYFTPINSFSIDLINCLPPLSTTVRRYHPPTSTAAVHHCPLPPSTIICRQLPPTATMVAIACCQQLPIATAYHCLLPPPSPAANNCRLPLPTIVCRRRHRHHCFPLFVAPSRHNLLDWFFNDIIKKKRDRRRRRWRHVFKLIFKLSNQTMFLCRLT